MRNAEKARRKFKEILGESTNFMTPEVIDYFETDNHFIELSKGTGIKGGNLYGVTVLTKEGERCYDLDDSFKSYKDAEIYINDID